MKMMVRWLAGSSVVQLRSVWALAAVCVGMAFSGCGSGSGDGCTGAGCVGSIGTARHEHEFTLTQGLMADARDTVVVQFDAGAPHANDSGDRLRDVIPYRYDETVEHQFCFAPDESGTAHAFVVNTADGEEKLRIGPGECETVTVEAGDYNVELHHADPAGLDRDEMVFIRPYEPLSKAEPARPSPLAATSGASSCSFVGEMVWSEQLLKPGEVAIWSQSSAPRVGTDRVAVYSGSCHQVAAELVWVAVGPSTQVVTFSHPNWQGFVFLLKSKQNNGSAMTEVPAGVRGTGAIAVSSLALHEPNCELESAGGWCHCGAGCGCVSKPTYASEPMVASGQAMVVGQSFYGGSNPPQGTKCCSTAHVLRGHCDDLGLIGFDEAIYGVMLADNDTMVELYGDAKYAGLESHVDHESNFGHWPPPPASPLYFDLPATNDGSHAGGGTISSMYVVSNQANNRKTLISTRACTHCDLEGVDLHDTDLSNTRLDFADLSNATLTRTQFVGASMVQTKLVSATASYANFSEADLTKAVFAGANQKPAVLTNVLMQNTKLDDAVLDGVDLANSMIIWPEGATPPSLVGASLVGANLTGVVLWGAKLDNATLSGANLSSAVALDTSFKNVRGGTSASEKITFSQAVLYGCDFTGTDCEFCDFSNALISFTDGHYDLEYITSYDKSLGRYQSKSFAGGVAYQTNFPNLLPFTNHNTSCPDTSPGPCDDMHNGGESDVSCAVDCRGSIQCENAYHCVALPWAGSSPGRWQCRSGMCSPLANASTCGDGTCDIEDGESHSSCAADCPDAFECDHPKHCVGLEWTHSYIGHWQCMNHQCSPVEDDTLCSDGVCDHDGRWSAAKIRVDYLGANDLNGW